MNRRQRGEGSISRRPDGRWAARVDLGWQDGRRARKMLYGRTQRQVVEKLRQALQEHRAGTLQAGKTPTVGQFLGTWLPAAKASVRPSTFTFYEFIAREHLIPALGRTRLDHLTPADVEALLARKQAGGLSPRTCSHIRAVLRGALAKAVRWGMLSRNVAALADAPKAERVEYHVLNPEQARVFLDAVRGDRLEALYTVALGLGLRQGEALGLRWQDVDLEHGTLTVRHALQRVKLEPGQPARKVLVETKTARSRRTLALPAVVLSGLHEHRARQLEERLLAGSRWVETDLVFCTRNGTAATNTYVTQLFQAHLERAGLPRMRFHELRHSAASLLIAQGAPLRTVMEVLGHSTITLTANVYGHLFDEAHRDAASAMDRALGHSDVR